MKQDNTFENADLRMELKNGILYTHYKAGRKLTLEDIKRFVQQRLVLLNGAKYPSIIFDEGIISMDKAARDYFISAEGVQGLTSAAFIQNTFFSKMLFRFILRIGNPEIPLTTFRDLNDAIEWVKSRRKPHTKVKTASKGTEPKYKRMQPAA